ncbi:putative hydrolase YxeP [bioreactor metagenome]|uniref:Putative hydrolase YxeP n=1 Tax=bioreactor metagenome TaxID=1076179 RepID=A0A645HVC7_9ZZZZ
MTTFHGGDVFNVIPDSVTMTGSVRSFNPELRENVPKLMERIIKGICEAHGASYTFNYDTGFDMVINNEEFTQFVEETILEVWEPETLQKMEPMMGSEDFSAFANAVPGCFVVVGAANEEKGITYSNHHPRFDMDEDALAMGLKLLVNVAKKITMA